jgi:LytS/YehU family sensor histidine kinase
MNAPRTPRHDRGYWLRMALISVTAGFALAVLFAMFAGGAPFGTRLFRSMVHSAVMCGLAASILPRVAPRIACRPLATRVTVMIALLLSLPAVGSVISCEVISLAHGHQAFWPCLVTAFPVNALVVATLGMGVTLYESQRAQLADVTLELRTRELDHERARKMAVEARLASLESRVQPHFLFNTLNAISALIHEDPDRAERTVERLAALLRFSLDATERGIVPLDQELAIVADYLEIEKTRLGARLGYVLDVSPEARRAEILPLAVQTLVENSVKHAIAPRPEGGKIRVEASALDGRLVVAVWDDGPGFTADAMVPGHGLDNLQGRLSARYGDAATLDVARRDGGTLVTVSLPATPNRPAVTA